MSLYLTPRQVAERWAVSVRQVERLCASGALPAARLGGWRIRPADVEAYEQRRANGSVSSPSNEAPKQEAIRPVFGRLEDGAPLALPERWWELPDDQIAASSAAGRTRGAGRKRASSVRR